MSESLRDIQFIQVVIKIVRNEHVNFFITSFLILLATYLSIIAAFGRNIVHPFTDVQLSVDEQQTDSISLITSTFSIFFLLVMSLFLGKLLEYVSSPPLFGCLLVGFLVKNVSALNEMFYVNPRWEWCIRTLALTVILIRCGIGLSWDYLHNAMAVALGLGILTAAVESGAITTAAIFIFGWSMPVAFICGFVLTAVSPAVIVPVMLELQNQGLGTRKGIPTLVLASATLDNIFCITAFSVTVTIVSSTEPLIEVVGVTVAQLVIGTVIGLSLGWISWWFPLPYARNSSVYRTLILASTPSAVVLGGNVLGFPSAGIVAATLICFLVGVRWKTDSDDKIFYEEKAFSLLWNLFFMPLLFALIGMKLDFSTMTWTTVLTGCALIGIGVASRFLAGIVFSCCSDFNIKEQLVIALSLIPKATVQAALAPTIVSFAFADSGLQKEVHMAATACILTILLTAPLGQYILSKTAPALLVGSQIAGIAKTSVDDLEIASNGFNAVSTTTTSKHDENPQFQRF